MTRIGVAAQPGRWVVGIDSEQPCKSTEPSQDADCGVPAQLACWMMDAVHVAVVAASMSMMISVPAISLKGVILLVVSIARPTGGVTLMAC